MKKKTKVNKEKEEDQKEDENLQPMEVVYKLSNLGEAVYQILVKWEETNQLLKKQNELLEKRNQLVEDSIEYEDEEEEEEE